MMRPSCPMGNVGQGPFGIHWFLLFLYFNWPPFFVFFKTSCTMSNTSTQSSVLSAVTSDSQIR